MSDYAENNNSSNTLTDKIPETIKNKINSILRQISDKRQNKYSDKSDSNTIIEVDEENNNNDVILNAQEFDEETSNKSGENEHKDNLLSKTKKLIDYSKHILKSKNETLNSDMRELDKIAEDIVTKNRLIEINNKEIQKKNYRYDRNIAFGILALIIANIYLFNKHMSFLSIGKVIIITIILIIVYYLYITYLYNEHGLNKIQFKSPDDKINKEQSIRDFKKNQFIKKECDCSDVSDKDKNKKSKDSKDSKDNKEYGETIENNADNYYYDGTAPIQNKNMIFNSINRKDKDKDEDEEKQNFMIEWESSNHRAGVGLNKDQLDTIGISMEDTIERFSNPLREALPYPNLQYNNSNKKNSQKELSCVETSSIGSIQSQSINKNKAYQLDKWMTPTSDL